MFSTTARFQSVTYVVLTLCFKLRSFFCIDSLNDVIHRPNPKKHFLTRKHVVLAIKRENRFSGSKKSQCGNNSPI